MRREPPSTFTDSKPMTLGGALFMYVGVNIVTLVLLGLGRLWALLLESLPQWEEFLRVQILILIGVVFSLLMSNIKSATEPKRDL